MRWSCSWWDFFFDGRAEKDLTLGAYLVHCSEFILVCKLEIETECKKRDNFYGRMELDKSESS